MSDVQDIQDTKEKLNIPKATRKIGLTDTFGKVATGIGIAGMGVLSFELGTLLVDAVNTAPGHAFNPADYMAPGLISFGVSMGFGLLGMHLGRLKHRLCDEFNYQVKKEFAGMGFELVEDDAAPSGSKNRTKWVRRDYDYSPTVYRPTHDRFWEGFWLASIMNNNSGGGYSSGRSRSSSSSNNGQGAAIAIAAVVLAAAVAATAFVSYKSFQLNFMKKKPELLTGPEAEVFAPSPAAV